MKTSALLSILLFFIVLEPIVGQVQVTATPIPQGTNSRIASDRGIDFTRTNASNRWPAFYLFGDGFFSLHADPKHEYYDGGDHHLRVYSGNAYDPTLPTRLTTGVPTVVTAPFSGTGSGTARPNIRNNAAIDLARSWTVRAGEELIYVIPFTHPNTNSCVQPLSGTIELNLDPRIELKEIINPPSTPSNPNPFTYNEWATRGTSTITPIGTADVATWNFQNLLVGETRLLYVKVFLPLQTEKQLITSSATIDWDNAVGCIPETVINRGRSSGPRDPNNIDVDHLTIPTDQPFSQQLNYIVEFKNIGTWFAKDVFVDIALPDVYFQMSTIHVVDSDAPYTISYIDEETVRFTFKNIFLPGTQQLVCDPSLPYPPGYPVCDEIFLDDQCMASFSFNICTNAELTPGVISTNAVVIFDQEPPLATDYIDTYIEPGVPAAISCQVDDMIYESRTAPSTSTISSKGKPMKVYPNPFSNQLNIPYNVKEKEGEVVSIRIFSLSGQLLDVVHEGYSYSGTHSYEYNTEKLSRGVYLLEVVNGSGRSTQRIVKF